MKKIFAALAVGIAVAILFSGCTTTPTLTFQQQVSIACSAVNTELSSLTAAGVFTGGAQDTLTNQIQPDLAQVCASSANVNAVNLQSVVNAVLPDIQTIVDNSTLSASDKNIATLAINAALLAMNTAIAMQQAEAATPTSALAPKLALKPRQ